MAATARTGRAVIAGAGIVGAAAAYFLSRSGFAVTVLDATAPASGASGAADGAVSVASKRPGPMMEAALQGVALYRQLAAEGLFAGLFKERATLMIAQDEAEDAVLARHAAALAASGVRLVEHRADRLHAAVPVLSPTVRSAIAVEGEGHAIGYEIVHRLLAASGADVLRGQRVRAIRTASAGPFAAAFETDAGPITADVFVAAAGAGSAALLGLGDALRPRKGQLLVTERAPRLNAALPGSLMSCRYLMSKDTADAAPGEGVPVVVGRRFGIVVDPLRTGQFLIGGTREETDARDNDLGAVARLLGEAVALVPGIRDLRLLRAFAGVRTATADGRPLIGAAPGLANLVVATGFEGDGICLGPLAGRLVTEIATGATPSIDLSPFDPARFSDRRQAA